MLSYDTQRCARGSKSQFLGVGTGPGLPRESTTSIVPVSEDGDRVITRGKIKLSLFRSSRKWPS